MPKPVTPFARFANRTWGVGILLALVGVTAAKVVAPTIVAERPRALVTATGQVIAVGGLLWIALRLNRKLKTDPGEPPTADPR